MPRELMAKKDSQTLRVARELKDAEDAEDPQRHKSAAQVFVVCDAESDVVGQDGDHIDDTHCAGDVVAAPRCGVQAQQVLDGEYCHACSVQTEQFDAETFAARQSDSTALVMTTRHRLDDVGQHGDSDEETGDVVEHERGNVGVRVFECVPHSFTHGRTGD